jgi:PDDEXK-like domain of unknown function (DUF3799)
MADHPSFGETAAGMRTIDASLYHQDNLGVDTPTLSASIAHTLLASSPLHAWTDHPKLNPNFEREDDQKYAIGTVAHALLLEGIDRAHIVHADTWRTNAAKEERDDAISGGRIPLLAKDYHAVVALVERVREQLAEHEASPTPLTDGKPEQTIVWEEQGVLCRARLDWLRDDLTAIDDVKTTSRSASPEQFSRNLYSLGYDTKCAFYLRGVHRALGASNLAFRWVVVETSPPYALSVVSPGPDVLQLAHAKVDRAIAIWKQCLENDSWPGYPQRVCWANLPPWEETRWFERQEAA